MSKTITLTVMDAPFEQARTTTAFRIIQTALKKGYNVNVFAYEGAVYLPFSKQKPHANAVHGRNVEEEDHPLTKNWIGSLMALAQDQGVKLDWVNCGLCVDERGAEEAIAGCRRGGPKDLWEWAKSSDGTMIIGTN